MKYEVFTNTVTPIFKGVSKNCHLLLFFALFVSGTFAQQQNKKENSSTYITCSSFHVTKPLRDISTGGMTKSEYKEDISDGPGKHPAPVFKQQPSYPPDPVIQH